MNLELFIYSEYGYFIWPAFIFTFVSCFALYLKTKKELSKQEKVFFAYFKETKLLQIKVYSKKIPKKFYLQAQFFKKH